MRRPPMELRKRLAAPLLLASVAFAGLLALTCDGEQAAPGGDWERISVRAEVIEGDLDVTVEATTPAAGDGETWPHDVRVTLGAGAGGSGAGGTVVLDDARFAWHLEREGGEGDLVTAGRGCGASWSTEYELSIACTDDLQIVRLRPGETHAYPVAVYPGLGPLALRPGTYVMEQPIRWWGPEQLDADEFPAGDETGTLVLRLTYTVE